MTLLLRMLLRHISFTVILYALLLLPIHVSAGTASNGYSIVMASAPGTNLTWTPKVSSLFTGRTLYAEQTLVKGAAWERLCLGYFSTRKQAVSLIKKIQKIYPGAWIQQTPKKNFRIISRPSSTVSRVSKSVTSKPVPKKSTSTLTEKQLDSLMQRAKADFKKKRYTGSIRYFNALISAGEHKYSSEALELLGLARQRKGQRAHAVTTYKKYLKLYPDDDGAKRVSQRLAGLLTATSAPKDTLRMSTVMEDEFTTFGSLSQFYQANRASIENAGTLTTVSQLITFIDLTAIQKSNKFDHRYQLTSDHIYDFYDDDDDSDFRFVEAYYELNHRKTGTSGRVGRQTLRVGGFLRRFDGISAGYQMTSKLRINLLGGFPVDIDNNTSINDNKTFYGLIFETATFLKHWNMNLFYYDQKNDGLTDRRSTGTEVRYRDSRKSLFGMIDYDLFYDEINIVQLNANLLLDHGRTAYMNAFMRKTPILATSNALIGRQEKTLDELKKTLNIEQIYQLARDRTADSQLITVGGTQSINKKFQTTIDLTLSRTDATKASGGVLATESTGTDYFLSAQLVGNNLLLKRDTGVLGIRYSDTKLSDTLSLIANARFFVSRNWRVNPRLQYDFRGFRNGRSQRKIRVILKTDYHYLNKVRFDFDIGYGDTNREANGQSGTNNLFFRLGYRWDF